MYHDPSTDPPQSQDSFASQSKENTPPAENSRPWVSPCEDEYRWNPSSEQEEAEWCGGTVQELRKFRAYDWQCRAHTRKRRRCRNDVSVIEQRWFNPPSVLGGGFNLSDFRPGDPDFLFCSFHLWRIEVAR